MTVDQLESVILHGGSVRVPFVQKALEDVVGTDKIAKTVNADEAAVMGIRSLKHKANIGAIFRGAQLNSQFKVKDIRPKDYSTYPITIISNATIDNSKGTSQILFPRRTKLGNSKTLSFKTKEDVSFSVQYTSDADLPDDISRSILTANITGVAEKIENLKGILECHDPTVKVNIKLSDSGLVEVLHSEVQCELREKKNLADKFKGLFGAGKDKEYKAEEQVTTLANEVDFRSFLKRPSLNLRRLQMLPNPQLPLTILKRCVTRSLRCESPSLITLLCLSHQSKNLHPKNCITPLPYVLM